MARLLHRLRANDVTRLGPGVWADGGGLYLTVKGGAARSWIFRYRRGGRLRDHGLGPVHTINLALARQRAHACRLALDNGVDPIDADHATRLARKVEAAKTMTFAQAAEQYIETNRDGWRSHRSAAQWRQSLTDHAYPAIGALPVQSIDTGLVMTVIEPLWATKTETASRVRGRIEKILNWAGTRGYRTGENPARWRGHLQHLLPKKTKVRRVKNHAALPYQGIGAFMVELREHEGVAARALEFAILTAGRTGEVIGATWQEIDFKARQWIIPAERMKSGREHRVPLSDAAIAILEQMQAIRQSEFIFPGSRAQRPIGAIALMHVLRRMRESVTVHGFRSTFSTWCAESTGFPNDVREMSLAHSIGAAVERSYQRGDLFRKRRALMVAWAAFCASSPTADIVPIRAAQ